MIEVQGQVANLDFMLVTKSNEPVVVSFFERSQQLVRSIGAGLNYSKSICIRKISNPKVTSCVYNCKGFDVFVTPVTYKKEKFFHGLAISKELNERFLISTEQYMEEHVYNLLMKNFDLPLLKQWSGPILKQMEKSQHVVINQNPLIAGQHSMSKSLAIGNGKIVLDELQILACSSLTEATLEEDVSFLLKNKSICISERPQKKLEFNDMDSYFVRYGHTLVENLEKQLVPLTELNGNIDNMCLNTMRLFPQQAAQVNAVVKRLNKSSFCILNNGMGTGKTIEGCSICEAFHIEKWLRANPGKSLKDAYSDKDNINYRVIVMCPGHLVAKWASEIEREIPYAKVTILNDVSQLVEIKKRGFDRHGKEFFVLSKDFAKLSYQMKPLPRIRRNGFLNKKICSSCEKPMYTPENTCDCGCKQMSLVRTDILADAMECPFCKNLLVPSKNNYFLDEQKSLDYADFANATTINNKCYYCGEALWAPHVPNIGENKRNVWQRATHYTNKAHKGTKTVWVHEKFKEDYFASIQEKPLNIVDSETHFGVRKISPAFFIKRQLKGYFDIAIFDEAHLFKGAGTAQGNAMHAFIKASKKQLALTGTIAGGYASHLFYLLYRLNPRRMIEKGYKWTEVMKFVDKYGQIETSFQCSESADVYNTTSKGRQIGAPKERPGISPLIFTDFLLDSTVFLDLSDMSKYLPPLKEYVETVTIPKTIEEDNGNIIDNPEYEVQEHYNRVLTVLKQACKAKGGRTVLSSLLQFSLSYLDHPYATEAIKNSLNGQVIVEPKNFNMFLKNDMLLAKEKRLIELINKEKKEGRNCFVFAEYTGSPSTCVSYRLKSIIEEHCHLKGQVAVLESSSPCASKREEWMHKQAVAGIKVFITNPRNVETGCALVSAA